MPGYSGARLSGHLALDLINPFRKTFEQQSRHSQCPDIDRQDFIHCIPKVNVAGFQIGSHSQIPQLHRICNQRPYKMDSPLGLVRDKKCRKDRERHENKDMEISKQITHHNPKQWLIDY